MRPGIHSAADILIRFALVFVVSLTFIAATAPRASAGEFTVQITCEHAGVIGPYWQQPLTPGYWQKSCLADGVGMKLEALAAMTEQWRPVAWQFPSRFRPGITIKRVSAMVRGDNGASAGLSQGLMLAGYESGSLIYGPVGTVSEASGGEPQLVELDGSDVAGGAEMVLLAGRCVAASCGVAPPLEVFSLAVTFIDETLPIVYTTSNIRGGTPSDPWASNGNWISLTVSDQESGVSKLDYYNVDPDTGEERVWADSSDICTVTPSEPYFCGTVRGDSATIDFTRKDRWFEGRNRLMARVWDKAGNPRATSFTFRIDGIAPGSPAELRLSSERFPGWIGARSETLSWKNLGETVATDDATGIKSVRIDLIPLSGQSDPPPSVRVLTPTTQSSESVDFPDSGLWNVDVRVSDAIGNVSDAATKVIGIDTDPPAKPNLELVEWYGPERPTIRWHPPAPSTSAIASGVCDYELRIGYGSWETTGNQRAHILDESTGDGTHHVAARAVSCGGLSGASDEDYIAYDGTSPQISAGSIGEGWKTDGDAGLLSAQDQESGIESISYSVDSGPEQTVIGTQAPLSLSDGVHSVRFSSLDKAGNRSPMSAVTAHIDETPPAGWLESFDVERPTLVSGVVTDGQSGVARSTVQMRPQGGSDWTNLTTETHALGGESLRVSARFPDYEAPPGIYEIRLFTVDRAGHTSTTAMHRVDGSPATLRSPLRLRPKLKAAMVERHAVRCPGAKSRSVKKKCHGERDVDDLTVDFGRASKVRGTLVDSSDRPVAHATIALMADEEPIDGTQVSVGGSTTDDNGRFEATVPPGVNRRLIVRRPEVNVRCRPKIRRSCARARACR